MTELPKRELGPHRSRGNDARLWRDGAARCARDMSEEGTPLPRNVLAELQRDMARLGCAPLQDAPMPCAGWV